MKLNLKKLTVAVFVAAVAFVATAINTTKSFFSTACSGAKVTLVRAAAWCLGIFGAGQLLSTSAHAQASAFVTQMEDAADQMVVDLGAVLPIALSVAIVSVGVFIVWSIFKRLARG